MKRESGQVLIVGIVVLLVFLLAILFIFDIHNLMRSKFKIETGQQAAALAGADWQKESLNLIGEINLIKACGTLLEGDDNWSTALPRDDKDNRATRAAALQSRIDQLTEMQARVSFIGPLLGFAAAQQAAKANGLPAHDKLSRYVENLESSWRYREDYGGAKDVIRHFRWREPYTELIKAIVAGGIAVYPNSRAANSPSVWPPELAVESFYEDIATHKQELAAADPPPLAQTSWTSLRNFVKETRSYPFTDPDYRSKWWDIDFSLSRFPNESEIYTLGVATSFSEYSGFDNYDDNDQAIYRRLSELSTGSVYRDNAALPGRMNWFCFDKTWYPAYYRSRYANYDSLHYKYWFEGDVLRKSVKSAYRYEGPAAYAEGAVEVGTTANLRAKKKFAKKTIRIKSSDAVTIGTRRGTSSGEENSSGDYRPGSIAKALGKLENGDMPIAVPIILPVFDRTTLLPTYMPIPYGFGVLKPGNSRLETFLNWLAAQNSLYEYENDPPAGTAGYLATLQLLGDGEKFRFYGWNPDFSEIAFDAHWKSRLSLWQSDYQSAVYSQNNRTGAGWLQQPKRGYSTSQGTGETTVTDHINGGTATRVYTGSGKSHYYYVVTAAGHIVNNDELDPTVLYNSGGGGGHGGGFGGHSHTPDTQTGPGRF